MWKKGLNILVIRAIRIIRAIRGKYLFFFYFPLLMSAFLYYSLPSGKASLN
jgi:hypothetical protein